MSHNEGLQGFKYGDVIAHSSSPALFVFDSHRGDDEMRVRLLCDKQVAPLQTVIRNKHWSFVRERLPGEIPPADVEPASRSSKPLEPGSPVSKHTAMIGDKVSIDFVMGHDPTAAGIVTKVPADDGPITVKVTDQLPFTNLAPEVYLFPGQYRVLKRSAAARATPKSPVNGYDTCVHIGSIDVTPPAPATFQQGDKVLFDNGAPPMHRRRFPGIVAENAEKDGPVLFFSYTGVPNSVPAEMLTLLHRGDQPFDPAIWTTGLCKKLKDEVRGLKAKLDRLEEDRQALGHALAMKASLQRFDAWETIHGVIAAIENTFTRVNRP